MKNIRNFCKGIQLNLTRNLAQIRDDKLNSLRGLPNKIGEQAFLDSSRSLHFWLKRTPPFDWSRAYDFFQSGALIGWPAHLQLFVGSEFTR